MWSSQNFKSSNVNKKMKPRWQERFPITQVNYQRNNYIFYLSRNYDLHHIHNSFHIRLLKAYRKENQNWFRHRHYSEPGLVKNVRHEVEKAVNFRFRQPAREPAYQIKWKGYLPSQKP